ncbi:MAG TPA: hypothetical protein ENJ53_01495 [Phaeodactylibacter sp.]|nr:hypothetical protein [Phaeodactylibacter sp.]
MKNLLTLFLVLSLLAQFSCKPDPVEEATTDVELSFKGKYGAETFLINKEYDFNGQPIRFDQFNFYIGDVVLVKEIVGNPEETELVDIDFVDLSFKPVDVADAEKGFIVKAHNVPVGEYSGIKIGLGVPSELNKTKPGEYGSGHPLRNVAYYWTAWQSFIFSKTEAKIDVNNDGSFIHKLSYHTGSDEAYRTRFFAKDITLKEGATSKITFEMDVQQSFDGIDVMVDSGTQNQGDLEIINKVMDNMQSKVLSIEN